MPPGKKQKIDINKLNAQQVDKLKGKLVEVKRAGAHPVFVEITKKDSIKVCLIKADVPVEDNELKIEAMKDGSKKWVSVKETDKAINYQKIVVTTKVRGSF